MSAPEQAGAERLSVQVEGSRDEPGRVLMLARPRNGSVDVREFVGGGGPRDHTLRADEVYGIFERAERERRRVSESLYAIRLWLGIRA